MIRYIRHKDIDLAKWDRCVESSVNRRIYAHSWYLGIVSPGWDALVSDDYRRVFPVTHRLKAGISYLSQPFFAQQLGLFSDVPVQDEELNLFLNELRQRFRLTEIQLNSFNHPDPEQWETVWRKNHELELDSDYELLRKNYPQNTRRNIRKAVDQGVFTRELTNPGELIAMFREGRGDAEGKLRGPDYQRMGQIMHHILLTGQGFLLGAFSSEQQMDAAACFAKDGNRLYFLFAASAPQARDSGAMFYLIDKVIRDHAGRPLVLDFEGGDSADLGRFYKGFGARESLYPLVRINRLPGFISKLKKK